MTDVAGSVLSQSIATLSRPTELPTLRQEIAYFILAVSEGLMWLIMPPPV